MAKAKKKTAKKTFENLSKEEAMKVIRQVSKGSCLFSHELTSGEKLRTGVPTLDFLLDGGISIGKITILAGNPSSCKTTISLHILKALVDKIKESGESKYALWFDPEGAWDPLYAQAIGVDIEYVIVENRTKVLEDAFQKADDLIATGLIAGLVFDSLDALIPRKQEDNEYGNTMGSQAGALTSHLPSLYDAIIDAEVTTIFIKHAKVKMDTMSPGEIITFSGGKALRHFCDTIFMVKRLSNRNLSYTPIQVKADKTRSSKMGLTMQVPLGGIGLDLTRDLVDLAIANGYIEVGPSGWAEVGGRKIQGVDNIIDVLKEDPEFLAQLREDVYKEVVDVNCLATFLKLKEQQEQLENNEQQEENEEGEVIDE